MLEVKHLYKSFGNVVAVDDVSFKVEPGTIMGLIGPNGSGKTTIFRLILDFLKLEKNSEVLWNGQPFTSNMANDIGYLPEERGVYEQMTVEQQIVYFAELRGMKRKDIINQIDNWMERFSVKGKRTDKIKTLSKGNQQKVQLIATLIHEPKLVILDEPFSGLDPVNANLLQDGIVSLRDLGSVIIFSSHNMNNVESLCDNLTMIVNGEQVLYGATNDVRESFGRTHINVLGTPLTQEEILDLDGVLSVNQTSDGVFHLTIDDETRGPELQRALSQEHYLPVYAQLPPTLESIFKMKVGEYSDKQ